MTLCHGTTKPEEPWPPRCLLHKTWFVWAEPEKPSCKFFAWMPPAAASQRARCSAKRLRSLCFGSEITCGRRRTCPLNFKCLSSTKPWVLIQSSSVLGRVFIVFFQCFSYSVPDLTDLSFTRGSDNLGSAWRQLLWRETREGKGTPVNPPRLCFIAARNSITSMERGYMEAQDFLISSVQQQHRCHEHPLLTVPLTSLTKLRQIVVRPVIVTTVWYHFTHNIAAVFVLWTSKLATNVDQSQKS